MSVNKVILIGNLGKDPEVRYMPNGNPVANFSMATSESWKDKQTGEKKEKTEWHKISVFGPLADVVAQYVKKGSKLYIEGKLQTRKWQAQDGTDRYSTEVVLQGFDCKLEMLNKVDGQQNTQQPQHQQHQQAPQAPQAPQYQQPEPQQAPQSYGKPPQQQSQQQAQQQRQPAPQQQRQIAPQQPAPTQYGEPPMDFDDDIPF